MHVVFSRQPVQGRQIGPDIHALKGRKTLGSKAQWVAQRQSDPLFP
jgi:hypothetical protein